MSKLLPVPEIEALNQTELAYAAQEALGGPYRRPIVTYKPLTAATPELIKTLWQQYFLSRADEHWVPV